MAILQDAMQGQVPGQQPAQPAMDKSQVNPNAVSSPVVKNHIDEIAKMEASMPAQMKQSYDRVLIAGKKLLYAKETAGPVDSILADQNIPVVNKLGEGVANLVVMLDNKGNGAIPKEVIIPVAVTLMFEAADFMFEVGIDVTEQDLAGALKLMVYSIFDAYGMPPEQVDAMVGDMASKMDLGGGGEGEEAGEQEMESPEQEAAEEDEEAAFNAAANAELKRGM